MATVPTAPAMHTPTPTPATGSAASRGAASAAAPPADSITAAASCGGPTVRIATRVVSVATGRDNDHNPRAAMTTAAHMHRTPAMSLRPQYEAARLAVVPATSARVLPAERSPAGVTHLRPRPQVPAAERRVGWTRAGRRGTRLRA